MVKPPGWKGRASPLSQWNRNLQQYPGAAADPARLIASGNSLATQRAGLLSLFVRRPAWGNSLDPIGPRCDRGSVAGAGELQQPRPGFIATGPGFTATWRDLLQPTPI